MSITPGKTTLENSNVSNKFYLGSTSNVHYYVHYHEHSEENRLQFLEENFKDKNECLHHAHLPQGDLLVKWSGQLEKETLRAEVLGTLQDVQRCVERLRVLTFSNDSWRGRECAADEALLKWLTKIATKHYLLKDA